MLLWLWLAAVVWLWLVLSLAPLLPSGFLCSFCDKVFPALFLAVFSFLSDIEPEVVTLPSFLQLKE